MVPTLEPHSSYLLKRRAVKADSLSAVKILNFDLSERHSCHMTNEGFIIRDVGRYVFHDFFTRASIFGLITCVRLESREGSSYSKICQTNRLDLSRRFNLSLKDFTQTVSSDSLA